MTTPTVPAAATTTSDTSAKPRYSEEFVATVMRLCGDKGTQADLRSGIGRTVEHCARMHRHLVPLTAPDLHPAARQARYTVAALIAARPRATRDTDQATAPDPAQAAADSASSDSDRSAGSAQTWSRSTNLGTSLAEGVRHGALKDDSAEAELHLLTRQSAKAVLRRLPALTRHLQTAGVTISWAVLLEDLTWWDLDRDRIVTRWFDSYFRALYAPAADGAPTNSARTNESETNR
ncbi:type I-E CRISPR-associated protein Cse2/CasB [Streptacidiphilus sp. ASG 303]|uniref:type I-E CRISPR-associated protein Cse2/CasB n=1 Tax=Streptacidiphilus sp. ASG 303 TaxID=2896847 RepID=UPI001E3B4137|nr:type I-E CRISPR-associated protein Cse2/CasB [Streptacidiphilus sp. ASG 303]MCD0485202.1 type I-E CRISPR-associated protein Cse2/CasB [Streptacidiphilus sp. ASG 303]